MSQQMRALTEPVTRFGPATGPVAVAPPVQASEDLQTERYQALLLAGAVVTAVFVIVRNAWMSDDAYITLRTVEHFCSGRGLIWNPGERVQAYTHPLWLLVLSAVYWVTREAYFSTLAVSLVVTGLMMLAFVRLHHPTRPLAAAILFGLACSRAFVDYSTSGLENPLTHLLLVLFLGAYFRHQGQDSARDPARRLLWLGWVGALMAVNRMDSVLLILPAAVIAASTSLRRGVALRAIVKQVAVTSIPFVAWEVFSLIYYGLLVPNTALAKLNTGLPHSELLAQGCLYLLDSLQRDPLTLGWIGTSLGVIVLLRRWDLTPVALGSVLYLAYVVAIGGDFMTGRFLTGPLVVAAVIVARAVPASAGGARLVAVACLVGGLLADRPTLLFDGTHLPSKQQAEGARGITDEQAFWFSDSGLLLAARGRPLPGGKHRVGGETAKHGAVVEVGAAGFRGFFASPDVYLLDHNALADPLLSRLPSRPQWRPGHFRRPIPKGYRETLLRGKNLLRNKAIRALYKDVRTVTRGPLFRMKRFAAIWRLNTGHPALRRWLQKHVREKGSRISTDSI